MPTRKRPSRPRHKDPTIRLRDAALEYAAAIEVYGDETPGGFSKQREKYWDALRKAALAYRVWPRSRGRPLGSRDRVKRKRPLARDT